jgi:transketolase
MTSKNIDQRAADNIRMLSAAMVEKAKSGHPGGAMGGADFIHILYSEFLNFDPKNPSWPQRDRFFLDPGHMSPMLYSVLTLTGKFSIDDLKSFRQWGSPTPGHPELDVERGIENTSGPLGQGHVFAVGAAITERFLASRFGEWLSHKTYAYISDGGIQEEISQGGGRLAGHLGLNNLVMFFDSNDIQLSTATDAVTSEDTAAKYESWGWRVMTIDGSNADEIRAALKSAVAEKDKPVLIIGKTVIGKGAVTESGESFENQCSTHGQPLSNAGASFAKTIENLGGDASDPFIVFPDIEKYYKTVLDKKQKQANEKQEFEARWIKENPAKAKKYKQFFDKKLPLLDLNSVEHKPGIATRSASGNILAYLAEKLDNMIVASADLSNSDKTESFLKKKGAFKHHDFSGAFLEAGVSELTMAAISTGMALHGGVIPVCATFFVFSDYMKPAIRLAALMEQQVIYLWTHDAFRVGEDGPTHQPVEHEAQLRLLEQLRNHSKQRSLLALRPADSYEVNVAWELALENKNRPTALILSRQNIPDFPAKKNSTRAKDAEQVRHGAYIVNDAVSDPQVILIGNGSEVSTLVQASEKLLKDDGIVARVVSVISEGLFRDQAKTYQESIFPGGIPLFGLTAGLPSTLYGLVGENGVIHGLDHFGYSAPAGVLDEKFGFTPEKVASEVKRMLETNS